MTLLDNAEELRHLLESGAGHIDFNGIPAPWPRLKKYEDMATLLDQKLDDFVNSKEDVEDYNDSLIAKVIWVFLKPEMFDLLIISF